MHPITSRQLNEVKGGFAKRTAPSLTEAASCHFGEDSAASPTGLRRRSLKAMQDPLRLSPGRTDHCRQHFTSFHFAAMASHSILPSRAAKLRQVDSA